jgi:hypothetical protein
MRSFLPINRVSRRLLDHLDEGYRRGWSGHHETIYPTVALHRGLTVEDFGGSGPYTKPENINRFYWNTSSNHVDLAPGTFVYRPIMRTRPRKLFWPLSALARRKYQPDKLWHPVKRRF